MPEFETTAQGCRLATSVGGVLTGRGADTIIIDDPLKPEEALSQTQRRAANEWFDPHPLQPAERQATGRHRADHAPLAREPALGRDPGDDLVGHVLAQEDWEVVRLPAIAEDDETQIVDTVWGAKLLTRHQDEALHPAREPLPMLEHLRHMIGEYNFAGQYQQMPTPLGGGLVKAAWHLPDTAPWLNAYLHELASFPNGRHDDQVDSTAQMLEWFKRGSGPSSNAGIFELYRRRAEEARGQQAQRDRRVRLRVPPGIGHRNLLLLNVAADGTVEMLEEEAESFLRAGWVRVDAGDLAGTGSKGSR